MGRPAKALPSLEELHRRFHYDRETGHLIRKVRTGRTAKAGSVAGYLNQTMSGKSYVQVHIDGQVYYAHRICWALAHNELPTKTIDHINGDGTDNRLDNLRHVSQSVNLRNIKKPTQGASGVRGVCYHKTRRTFVASINDQNGRRKQLGYGDLLHCVALRKSAEQRLGYL